MLKFMILSLFLSLNLWSNEYFYYHHDKKVKLTPKQLQSHNRWLMKTENGRDVIVTSRIIVKTSNKALLDKYLQDYNASIKKELGKDLFLLKVEDVNQTLDIVNSLHDKEGIIYIHPDLIRKRFLR